MDRLGRRAWTGQPRGGRALCVALSLMVAATVGGAPTAAAPRAVTTAASVYAPAPNATTVEGGLYSSVVSDGVNYHSVMRVNAGTQTIQYRRSADGGRTWVTGASWAGESGGATRPSVAVSGRTVAITFIGGYCVPGTSLCGEAAYLVRSADSGRTFTSPLRLSGGDAFDAGVGVDGARIWVAWSGRNVDNDATVFLRRYAATAATPERAENWPGVGPVRMAAGGGGGVMTFLYEDPLQAGKRVPRAQLLRGDSFGVPVDLPDTDPSRPFQWLPIGVAAAQGRVHLLFQDGARAVVRSANVEATQLGPVVNALSGTGSSIAARRGLVAVAAVDAATGITSVARSSDGWAFSEPTAVAQTTDRALSSQIGLAVEPESAPSAILTWSVAPRYTDRDADGIPDPANAGSAPPVPVTLPDGGTVEVTLDARASLPGAGAARIADCYWRIDDVLQAGTACRLTSPMTTGRPARVSLAVVDDKGLEDTRVMEVTPKDLLVVSLGDSVASGEGNPHVDASLSDGLGSDVWEDGPCHRSHYAGPALAARQLEERDPHSSVTFVQLACSGAAMLDVPKVPGQDGSDDDPATGGVLDQYKGVEPAGSGVRESQIAQMTDLIGSRTPDSVMLSIGANDVVFSDVLKACLLGACTTDGTKATLDARLAELPDRYAALGAALEHAGVPDRAVTISQYYDVSSNDEYLADLKCVANATNTAAIRGLLGLLPGLSTLLGPIASAVLGDGIVTDDEAVWARDYLGRRINEEVRAGAQAQGWATVGGFEPAFARHGYCASDPWIVSVPVSAETQHDEYGSFHPNRGGHREYGRRMGNALLRALVAPPALAPDAAPLAAEPGDAYVTTTTEGSGELTIAALRDEGVRLAPLGVRRLDRPSTSGATGPFVGSIGPPAADPVSAVATWYQLDDPVGSRWRSLLAQGWLVENASLGGVEITQAAFGAGTLVAGRRAVVVAGVTLGAAEPRELEMTAIVTDDQDREVARETAKVRLTPGAQSVGLLRKVAFTPVAGSTYSAKVTIVDPPSASPAGAADNVAELLLANSPTVTETRPLRLLGMPLLTSEGAVDCAKAYAPARAMRNLRARVPVTSADADAACSTLGTFDTTRRGASEAVSMLDYFARIMAVDSVVGVAQDQWLYRAQAPGTLAIANLGGRGIVFNGDAEPRVVTHEATHNLGFDHVERSASGWDVASSSARSGRDYMDPFDGDNWVSGRMWDDVARQLGGSANTPRLPDPASSGFWVRGEVVARDDGSFGIAPGRWVPAAVGEVADPRLGPSGAPAPAGATSAAASDPSSGLDLSRITARQVDKDGTTLTTQSVPLEPVGGVFQPGTTHDGNPLGYTFSGLVTPEPGAATVELWLDGKLEETRAVNERPVVTAVTAPLAGADANRGEPLTVAWDALDPDGDTLTADLLISDDGGTTWHPLAYDVTTRAVVTVPADLDGSDVKVRVVVSDGVRMGFGDSAAFTVGGTRTEVRDRIVYSQHDGYRESRFIYSMHAMDLDGSDEVPVALPANSTWDQGVTPTNQDCRPGEGGTPVACPPAYVFPSWADDGSRIYFSSNLVQAGYGGAATGQRDFVPYHLWSVKPDGTDLRRITDPLFTIPQSGGYRGTNTCPNVSAERIAWIGEGNGMPTGIWTATLDGADQKFVFKGRSGYADAHDQVRYPWPTFVGEGWLPYNPDDARSYLTIYAESGYWWAADGVTSTACPRFSPDGSQIAFVVSASQRDGVGTGSLAVVVMDADGGNQRIVTDALEQITGVDWLDGDRLLLTKSEAGATWDKARYTAITLDLRTQGRTVGASWPITDGPVSLRALGTTAFGPTTNFDPTNSLRNYDLATVTDFDDPASTPVKVVKDGSDKMFDGIRTTVTTGGGTPVVTFPPVPEPTISAGGPYTTTVDTAITLSAEGSALADTLAQVAWDLDGDGAFDDAVGASPEVSLTRAGDEQVRVRVTPASGPATTSDGALLRVLPTPPATFEVATDASGTPSVRPDLRDLRVTIPAGVATQVHLDDQGGAERDAGPFWVLAQDVELAVASGPGATTSVPPTSGADGTVLVTPAAAFRGIARFTYARSDQPDVRREVVVEVTGNALPTPGDDALTAAAGIRAEVDPATLLANDSDPDAAPGDPGLQMVSVAGMTSGEAWLSADRDRVVVVPGTREPSASFTYTVRDPQGALATATVRVSVAGTETPAPDPGTPSASPSASPAGTDGQTQLPGVVAEPTLKTGMLGTLSTRVLFAYRSTDLRKAEKRKLRKLVAAVPGGASMSTAVVGVVRAKGATKADLARAVQRARVVRDYLATRGLSGRITVANDARTASRSASARRVNVTIRYVTIP